MHRKEKKSEVVSEREYMHWYLCARCRGARKVHIPMYRSDFTLSEEEEENDARRDRRGLGIGVGLGGRSQDSLLPVLQGSIDSADQVAWIWRPVGEQSQECERDIRRDERRTTRMTANGCLS
jgi:hypothetical protein